MVDREKKYELDKIVCFAEPDIRYGSMQPLKSWGAASPTLDQSKTSTTSPGNPVPNNIYQCDNGTKVGINRSCCKNGDLTDYYINGEKLISSGDNVGTNPSNNRRYSFTWNPPNLIVDLQDDAGNQISTWRCVHIVSDAGD